MKALPNTKETYKQIWRISMGPVAAKLMMSALELRLFNHLQSFCSADDVARRLGTHKDNTRRLLDALATIDLVEKKDRLYRNLPSTQAFLVDTAPAYIGGLLRISKQMAIDPLEDLLQYVQKGPLPGDPGRDFSSEALWAQMTRDSAPWVLGETGEKIAGILSRLPGFASFEKMLDLGGGHGLFAVYIVNAHPAMQGVVFDRAAVTEVARTFIDQYGMTGRVTVAAGDYLSDDIGDGYDLVWASATLNFAKFDMDPLITKILASLKPGGYFASFQDGMTHEHTKPEIMLGHLAGAMQSNVNFSLDQGFLAEAMIRCGFQSVRSRTIETPMGAMDLDIARKAVKD
jgi:predicted O-methyltransferase YrrM